MIRVCAAGYSSFRKALNGFDKSQWSMVKIAVLLSR